MDWFPLWILDSTEQSIISSYLCGCKPSREMLATLKKYFTSPQALPLQALPKALLLQTLPKALLLQTLSTDLTTDLVTDLVLMYIDLMDLMDLTNLTGLIDLIDLTDYKIGIWIFAPSLLLADQ